MDTSGPNAKQIEYWNEQAGPKWVEETVALDAMTDPIGRAAIERAAVARGARVLDVGCGAGQTSVQLGEQTGPDGSVLGLDIAAPLLAVARERAARAGLAQVRFEQGDAQTHFLERDRDLVFSRFGVMFFADPVAAFHNLRRALVPGGRVTFACWQEPVRNPWMRVPMTALARYVDLPPPEPGAPGPFSLCDPERVRTILARAGFADVKLEPLERPIALGAGGGLDEALRFLAKIGPAARLLVEHPEVRERALAAVRDALEAYVTPEGVTLGSSSWIVTATRRALPD